MLLAFDVGNTNIVLGLFQDGRMITNWRLETDNNKSADRIRYDHQPAFQV